ncbi:2-oxoacid:acceptor oxidoreductase family protein [Roseospirillum parvum]|uniref:Pyruvate ferredoxin oxidoreductase gamma subunit n=1 Tax=Roseospirillum parvum TaxID=83401 RepID=A0A1G7XJU6_9PROT|nr:2-oxoacid:acceptor oxidoreductase family protein [Roseospirillum parvum]SDG84331.1 pyruvate ferredoxin oxidoreductase gamma subunit [Roseospirillum parvum]
MIEIRIHGRGGQGNVVAAYLLASAAFAEGAHCQAFPSFGAERRGAPVTAFVRIAPGPILARSQVRNPAALIVQDDSLLHIPGTAAGLLKGGGVLVNAPEDAATLSARHGLDILSLPATALALEYLGRPTPNVALLAAFLTVTGLFPLSALSKALGERFSGEVLRRNEKLVARAAEAVPEGAWANRLVLEQPTKEARRAESA